MNNTKKGRKLNLGLEVIEELKKEMTNRSWERYIKPLIYDKKGSNEEILRFFAPNILMAKWVKTKFGLDILNIVQNITNLKPKIEIEVINSKNRAKNSQKNGAKSSSTILNPSFTFDSFIVGQSNQFAYTTAKSVAEKPGEIYNPLFIYGGVGLGKTHLVQAIGNYQIENGKKVIYTTFEQFMNRFTAHLKVQNMSRFREHFRECDVLIIDDIQFLTGKEQTQEEFFHTFNELHQAKKQIIITSDRPPNRILGLVDRLKSRFEWGLMADIQPPGLDTKISIIKKKCEIDGIRLNDEIINFLASNMGSNIREIEGAIIKLNAYSGLMNQELTLEFAHNVIKDQLVEKSNDITIDDVVEVIAREYNVKISDIKSQKRKKVLVTARRVAIYLSRELTTSSMPQIAIYFSKRDHTSISHAIKKVSKDMELDNNFKLFISDLSRKINSSKSKID